jgi:hypothetical protein
MDEGSTRRRVLASVATAGVAGVAGCLTGGDGSDDDGIEPDGDGTGAEGADSDGTADDGGTDDDGDGLGDGETDDDGDGSGDGETVDGGTTSAEDLDLREANVSDVTLDSQGGGDVRFSVTLVHDDDGEDGYANWWAVETRDGEELGRRDLAHAHGTREFTRSETVSVPGEVDCVVVRGHDQTHEYGGQAAVVSMASGATRFATQGSESSSFANADCP